MNMEIKSSILDIPNEMIIPIFLLIFGGTLSET